MAWSCSWPSKRASLGTPDGIHTNRVRFAATDESFGLVQLFG